MVSGRMTDAPTGGESDRSPLRRALDRIPDEPSQRASTAREMHRIIASGTFRQRQRVVFTTADTAEQAKVSGEWLATPDAVDLGVMR